jgi:hypothetical protein
VLGRVAKENFDAGVERVVRAVLSSTARGFVNAGSCARAFHDPGSA